MKIKKVHIFSRAFSLKTVLKRINYQNSIDENETLRIKKDLIVETIKIMRKKNKGMQNSMKILIEH